MSVNGSELLPLDRATLYFERARQLSLFSSGTSLELERLLREIYKALSYENAETKFYLLLGKIYKLNLDITSSMFCYRFILKQNQSMIAGRKFLIELLILKGKEYMLMGIEMKWKIKFTAARSCFDEALEYNRENLELWILKSVCHVHCNELVEAYEAISKVIKPNRDISAEVYILRAKINWARGLTEQGNQDIRVAASIDSNHPEVLGFISRSYARSELLYREALYAFTLEKYKESLELVDHALHITNEDIKLYILKARIYRMLHELQLAYEAIMKAKDIFEEKYQVDQYQMNLPPEILLQTNLILNEMAIDYASKGDYHQSILLYNKIIRSEEHLNATLIESSNTNNTTNSHHNNSMMDLTTATTVSAYTGAVTPSNISVTSSPRKAGTVSTNNTVNTATTTAAVNQGSILTRNRGPTRHYINYKYYMNRADCYRALHQYSEAIHDYTTAYELSSDDWTIRTKLSLTHYLIATNYFNESFFYEADIELSKAIYYNPKVSEYYSLRGKAKYYLSDFIGSHSDYKKVVELDPSNIEIKMRLQQFEDIKSSSSGGGGNGGGSNKESDPHRRTGGLLDQDEQEQEKILETMINSSITKIQQRKSTTSLGNSNKNSPRKTQETTTTTTLTKKKNNTGKDYKEVTKELLLKTKEREKVLEDLLEKSRYTTERKVKKFYPESNDYLQMMLHPKEAMKLPPLKLITTELKETETARTMIQNILHQAHLDDDEKELTVVPTKDQGEVFLPKILAKSQFLPAHLAKLKIADKEVRVKESFNDRKGAERDELWKIVDTAKEIALSKTTAKLKASTEKAKQMRMNQRKTSNSEKQNQTKK